MTSPQSYLNHRQHQADQRAALRIAGSVLMALMLAAVLAAGFALLTTTLAALPDIIAESAARRVW